MEQKYQSRAGRIGQTPFIPEPWSAFRYPRIPKCSGDVTSKVQTVARELKLTRQRNSGMMAVDRDNLGYVRESTLSWPVDTQACPFEPSRGQKGWTGSR
jgi:hypothetical protein